MASSRVRAARFVRRNSIGLLALFIALGGTSYAAATLPKNSVGSAQIQPRAVSSTDIKSGAVTQSKIKSNSVISSKIKDGSIYGADIKDGAVSSAKLAKSPAVRLQPGNTSSGGFSQTVANTGQTLLILGTATQFNNDFSFGTGVAAGPGAPPTAATTLRIPVSGVYSVTAGVRWTAPSTVPATLGTRTFSLGTSAGSIPVSTTAPGTASTIVRQNLATTLYLTAGTELYLFVNQDSSDPLQVSQSQGATHFAAALITQ